MVREVGRADILLIQIFPSVLEAELMDIEEETEDMALEEGQMVDSSLE